MSKAIFKVLIVLLLATILPGCMATMHTVGSGGRGDCKTQYDATAKRVYLFWGLVPLTNPDSKAMAGGAQNYTIRTTTTFIDGLIALPGAYLLGLRTQTIRVSKGDQ